jgi:hypothetical protein
MADGLDKLESQLRNLIEKHAVRLFSGGDIESKLVEELIKALQAEIEENADGDQNAPHIFALNVNPKYVQDIRSNQTLLDSLSRILLAARETSGLTFESDPSITVFPDETINEGDFSIRALRSTPALETHGIAPASDKAEESMIPPRAFLIVGGSKIFPLELDVVNVGRKLSNALVIDDARVSRNHAQLRAVKGRYMLFDLNSTGGTFVNGKRITQSALHPGDVISLSGVPMVYGQDAVRAVDETQEYVRPNKSNSDSTTASIDINELDLDNLS